MHKHARTIGTIATASLLAIGLLMGGLFFLARPARASSRPVNSTEIRRAQRDDRKRYGPNYYMYGAIRSGRKYYLKGNKWYRVPGR